MLEWTAQLGILLEVSLAMLLGGMIGLEREFAQRPAGFRTHMLIAGAAALLVGLGEALLRQFLPVAADVRSDPIRIVEAVVAAVGFIGAGSILRTRRGDDVQGLTTAASLLMSAAIGISVAVQQYLLAAGVTALSLLVLLVLRGVEVWVGKRARQEQ